MLLRDVLNCSGVINLSTAHPVPHCPIALLPLLPHSEQYRMPAVYKINDFHICLAGMLTVQTTSILLQRALPGHRHGQHQCI